MRDSRLNECRNPADVGPRRHIHVKPCRWTRRRHGSGPSSQRPGGWRRAKDNRRHSAREVHHHQGEERQVPVLAARPQRSGDRDVPGLLDEDVGPERRRVDAQERGWCRGRGHDGGFGPRAQASTRPLPSARLVPRQADHHRQAAPPPSGPPPSHRCQADHRQADRHLATAAKRTTAKRTVAKRTTTARPAAKRTAAKRTVAKRTAVKRTVAKRTAVRSTVARPAAKRTTTARPAARKTAARKPAARKTAIRSTSTRRVGATASARRPATRTAARRSVRTTARRSARA